MTHQLAPSSFKCAFSLQFCGVAFSPTGQTIATAGHLDNTARLWMTSSGETLAVLQGDAAVHCVAFRSRDGSVVAVGDRYGAVSLWDVHTTQRLARHAVHDETVHSVRFDALDARQVASSVSV